MSLFPWMGHRETLEKIQTDLADLRAENSELRLQIIQVAELLAKTLNKLSGAKP